MSAKTLKALSIIFGFATTGIAISLVMTIYTGVREHKAKSEPVPISIPLPATSQ